MKRVTGIGGIFFKAQDAIKLRAWYRDRIEEYEYGKFAWIMDPEGNRIELWEPLVPGAQENGG